MTTLKIDRDARRRKRWDELARIMREAMWGDESVKSMPIHRVVASVVAWHARDGADDALNAGIETVVEAASLGVIRQVGRYWRPGWKAQSAEKALTPDTHA